MPNATTPATDHDANYDAAVRIPEQFPEPTSSAGSEPLAKTALKLVYAQEITDSRHIADVGHFVDIPDRLAASAELNLTIDNFHPVSGVCYVSAFGSFVVADNSVLTISLGGESTLQLNINPSESVHAALVLVDKDYSSDEYSFIVLSSSALAADEVGGGDMGSVE